ncbi:hypothetical protein V8C40DRAFT_278713 [Trichoderma camerunense]
MQRHFSPDIVHVTCFSSIRVLRQTGTVEPWTAPVRVEKPSSRVQTHRFHWLHHCNKLMVAPSSAADGINPQPGSRWTPRLTSHCRETEMAFPAKGESKATRVGAKGWAARGPSSSSCKIISAYEIPTQGCTSTS